MRASPRLGRPCRRCDCRGSATLNRVRFPALSPTRIQLPSLLKTTDVTALPTAIVRMNVPSEARHNFTVLSWAPVATSDPSLEKAIACM